MPENPTKRTLSDNELVEREHLASGALHLTAFTAADAPDGGLARLRVAIGLPQLDLTFTEVRPAQALELGLALIAWSNGNWASASELEQERRGQLTLLGGGEVSHG